MKKIAISMAALACAVSAHAQSSVTVFGVVDATLQHIGGILASVTRLHNSGLLSSRIGSMPASERVLAGASMPSTQSAICASVRSSGANESS